MIQELQVGDFVYGWWAVLADDGTNFLVCLMRRKAWNFIFRLDNREPGNLGVNQWCMAPADNLSMAAMRAKLEEGLDAIFAVHESRRQVFVEVMSYDIDKAAAQLHLLHDMGFPVKAEDLAPGA